MKRFVVSSLTLLCGLAMTATAHASFAEKNFTDTPGWKSGTENMDETERVREMQEAEENNEEEVMETQINDEPTNDNTDDDDTPSLRYDSSVLRAALNGNSPITRAQFTALMVRSFYDADQIDSCFWELTSVTPPRFNLLFKDVPTDHPYAKEICMGMKNGLVRGYGNDIFGPNEVITMADAAKILARAHGLTPWVDASKPTHWFDPYIQALGRRNAIPISVESIEEKITVNDAIAMIDRLGSDDRNEPSRTADELIQKWERMYNPPRRVVSQPRVIPIPSSRQSTSTPKAASTASKASVQAVSSKPLVPTSAGASSREKAWYEF